MTIDTKMTGILIDRDFAEAAERVSQHVKSATALAAFKAFRESSTLQYLVVAGQLHRENGGACGGLAAGWEQAKALFAFAGIRFDEIAEVGGESFAAKWFLFCSDGRRDEIKALASSDGREIRMATA